MKRKYVRKISAIIASGITASTLPLVVSSCSCGTTNKTTTYTLLPSIDILNQTDNLSTINAYKNNVNYNPISWTAKLLDGADLPSALVFATTTDVASLTLSIGQMVQSCTVVVTAIFENNETATCEIDVDGFNSTYELVSDLEELTWDDCDATIIPYKNGTIEAPTNWNVKKSDGTDITSTLIFTIAPDLKSAVLSLSFTDDIDGVNSFIVTATFSSGETADVIVEVIDFNPPTLTGDNWVGKTGGDLNWVINGSTAKLHPISSSLGQSKFQGELNIPKRVLNRDSGAVYTVEQINGGAFASCTDITKVTIPNSITSIATDAFAYCTGIVGEVKIPNSVTFLGSSVFSGCTKITSVILPNTITSIKQKMFDSCTSLSTIEIPNTVTTIEERGFYNCSSLEYLLIPASVSTIGNNGFMWCNKIKTLVFDGFSAAPTSFAASTFSQWNSQVNWDGEVYSINYTNDWDSQAALTFAQTKSLPTTGWTAVTT